MRNAITTFCICFMSHLSEQISKLFVDLGPEGGACYIDEGLSVHFPSHLHIL